MQTPSVDGETSQTSGTVSTLFSSATALPSLQPRRYQCSTVQWAMGIANYWQSEFHSRTYTRRQLWKSARIYSLLLSQAGRPRIRPLFLFRKQCTRVSHVRASRSKTLETLDIVYSWKMANPFLFLISWVGKVWQWRLLSNSSRTIYKEKKIMTQLTT